MNEHCQWLSEGWDSCLEEATNTTMCKLSTGDSVKVNVCPRHKYEWEEKK